MKIQPKHPTVAIHQIKTRSSLKQKNVPMHPSNNYHQSLFQKISQFSTHISPEIRHQPKYQQVQMQRKVNSSLDSSGIESKKMKIYKIAKGLDKIKD